jgi:hypothetical protein
MRERMRRVRINCARKFMGKGEGLVKSFVVVVSALLFLVIAAAHAYRAYAGIELSVAHHAVPIMCSWVCAGVTGLLGILLLAFARK